MRGRIRLHGQSDCPEGMRQNRFVLLLSHGDAINYTHEEGTLRFFIPESLKAIQVTDVVKVEFGKDFDPKPYLFTHW